MELSISHTTEYAYSAPVDYVLKKMRLRPLRSVMQQILVWSLEITGGKIETSYADHYGNHVGLVSIASVRRCYVSTQARRVKTLNTSGMLGSGLRTRAIDTSRGRLHDLFAAVLEAQPYKTSSTAVDSPAEDALQGLCTGIADETLLVSLQVQQ